MGIIKVAICDDDQYMCEKVHDFLKLFFSRQHITVLYYFFADGMYLLESDEIFDISVIDYIDVIKYNVGDEITLEYQEGKKTNTVINIK